MREAEGVGELLAEAACAGGVGVPVGEGEGEGVGVTLCAALLVRLGEPVRVAVELGVPEGETVGGAVLEAEAGHTGTSALEPSGHSAGQPHGVGAVESAGQ